MEYTTVQKGMFWLWLAVSGNFIAETLSCKTQILLSNNMYAKQIVTFAILYFVAGFVDAKQSSPIEHFKLSGIIWIVFLLFTKMHLTPTIISFVLVCISHILNDYGNYYIKNNEIEKGEMYKKYSNWTLKANLILILISFIIYLITKYKEYKGSFNFIKFILGNPTCKGT